ncbi:glutamyl-tRNA reductase [Haloimpatiens sp. FM7330]|uniref:glutamyl-tRNA reductase n=1 Tax=Haloimpatiens sp. FM7330 TaxID=3298610 RepID=UPI00362B9110
MNILVVGVNHNKTPIQIREKVSFTESKKIEAVNYLLDRGIREVCILSTCNRSEIYIASNCVNDDINIVKNFYKEFFKLDNMDEYLFIKYGKEAVSHIYVVAAGIDSVVLGEDQILGQVKDALQFSMELGASKKILNKLLREAVTAAKAIKSELKISEIPLSTSYIGIKFLRERLGTLKGKKAFIIGAGKISTLSLRYLAEEELEDIYITNRTHGKLKKVCFEFPKVKTVKYEDRYEVLKKVDILITATSAPHTIITSDQMSKLNKKLYIMDLAVPRDVEKTVGNFENITLYDIDDLKKISEENMNKRIELCEKATKVIEQDVEEYINWMKQIKVDPVIKSLNEKCKDIQDDTLDYINRKLQLNSREKKIIEKMLGSALRRVIREPIRNLKEIKEKEDMENYIEVVNQLFDF